MPVDASIYNNLNTTPYNPLKTIGDVTAIQNAQQQNQLLQINNQRGQVGLESDKVGLNKAQADLAMQQYNNLAQRVVPMVNDPYLNHQKIINQVTDAVADKSVSLEQGTQFLNSLAQTPDNPQALRQVMGGLANRLLDANSKLEQVWGKPIQTVAGGQIRSGVQAPAALGGGAIYDTSTPITTTPAEKMAATQGLVKNKDGVLVPTSIPNVNRFDDEGNPRTMGQETLPQYGKPGQPSDSEKAAAKVPENTVAGNVQTGYSSGTEEDMKSQALQGVDLQHIADSVPQRKALLGELEAITKSGDVNFGPGSDNWKKLLGGVQRLYGGDSETVAKYDTFNKLATQLAQQQFQSLGGTGTDTKLGSAISASPNTALSNRSNEDIIALLKGNEDAIKTKNNEWLKWKKKEGAGSYADFSSDFNNKFDPRVFQAQYMAPKDKAAMLDGLSDSEYAKYKKDYDTAHKSGWLTK